jgi:phage baseplate assembly protein W
MSIELYGNDLLLKDGDFLTTNSGDLYTARDYESNIADESKFEGYYNVFFALTNRLTTVKGDDVFDFEYGSDIFSILSSPNSPSLRQRATEIVTESLIEDDRVKSVQSVAVEQKGNVISIKAIVMLKGLDTVSELVFPNFVIE